MSDKMYTGSNAIELMDYGREGTDVDYAQKIQTFHRFVIDHMKSEANIQTQNPALYPYGIPPQYPPISPISQILGIAGQNVIMCSTCKGIRERIHVTHIVDMVYPKKVSALLEQPIGII